MSVIPWAWRCVECEEMVPHSAVEPRGEEWWHWDALRQAYCGRVEKVEIQ